MRTILVPLLLGLASCVAPPGHRGLPSQTAETYARSASTLEGTALAQHPDLRVTLSARRSVYYDISTFGPAARSIAIKLRNTGDHAIDVASTETTFTIDRNGAAFPCNAHRRATPRDHEPSWLAPGATYTLDRDIDCAMPLPGRYDVHVFIALGDSNHRGNVDPVGDFTMDILPGANPPHEVPSRPGLFVAMAGNTVSRPLPPEAWARGDYHVVVAMINATAQPQALGPVRLSFLTYKSTSKLPCSGQAEPLVFPERIAAGEMLTAMAPVACAPSDEGLYEIVGHVSFAGERAEVEIGKLDLAVTRDPLLFAPGPHIWELGP